MYDSPLATRYASKQMQDIFSDLHKHQTWRLLWYVLAREQSKLGLPITEQQLSELCDHIEDVDLDAIIQKERETCHDVMAHIHVYGEQCPSAKGILHLGATSCYVTDNADVLMMHDALGIIADKLITVCQLLYDFATVYVGLPCLGYTHYQPAQLTTVGKRATMWLQDFINDLEQIMNVIGQLKLRGVKGATGTQASFLKLFNDEAKVEALDNAIAGAFGLKSYDITGQTYSRKQDVCITQSLVQLAISATKITTDIRLLAHDGEIEEGFKSTQVGSSAMPYKRNPIKCERVASLSRFLLNLSNNTSDTAASQWLERTLDDSANRRLTIAECFLTADSILELLQKILKNMTVNNQVINKRVMEELPFIAVENLMMELVLDGGDRQEMHNRLKQHSMAAKDRIRNGFDNDLLERISNDSMLSKYEIETNPRALVGMAPKQAMTYARKACEYLYQHQSNVFKTMNQRKELIQQIKTKANGQNNE